MPEKPNNELSRRERQVMQIVYRLGRARAADVRQLLPDESSYSAVRALLRVLEEKGHLTHEMDKNKYVYVPTVSPAKASQSALENVLHTFFDGSAEKVVATLLKVSGSRMSEADLERIAELIDDVKKEGR